MRVALDTNILAYAEGVNGPAMKKAALELIERLPQGSIYLPIHVLGELFQVSVRKAGRSPSDARSAILAWRNAFHLVETSPSILVAALELAIQRFGIWDAVILSAAAEADCQLLLSEDMQHGFVWSGVAIVNPFAKPRHSLLDGLLSIQP